MTKFGELQQDHQSLLERQDTVTDQVAFVRDVQAYVTRVCEEAVDVPTPRDRDQLRANLRYWASYLYDATGTYPNTTMRPAHPVPEPPPGNIEFTPAQAPVPAKPTPAAAGPVQAASFAEAPAPVKDAPPPKTGTFSWRTGLVVVIVALLVGLLFVWRNANTQFGAATSAQPAAATVQPDTVASGQALTLSWRLVTAGPSPFNPNTWVARIELSATGGNDEYIFWVNGQRLPDASNNQFTVESQGCEPVGQFIGVTSGGQSVRQQLVIQPPGSSSCAR